MSMKLHYQEHDLKDVVRYFIDGFKLPKGKSVFSYEWFIDTSKGKMVLRLMVKTEEGDNAISRPA